MLSLYEILKASKTGIAPDMWTALAGANFGSLPEPTEHEYTGAVPVTFNADGTPLLDYLISGNMSQTGTPTPTTPIYPSETGERTGNLFDADRWYGAYKQADGTYQTNRNTWYSLVAKLFTNDDIGKSFCFAADVVPSSGNACFAAVINGVQINGQYIGNRCEVSFTVQTIDDKIIFDYGSGSTTITTVSKIMLNTGSQPLPYEPYGYKLDISSANTTTPVYLGEIESTRRIKKLVLTGTNADGEWKKSSTRTGSFYLNIGTNATVALGLCDRAVNVGTVGQYDSIGKMFVESSGLSKLINLWLFDTNISLDDFKSYLAAQYAAGTPVTVWYVLATEETAVVNEPLRKIGEYADTVSMEQAGISIPTNNGSTTVDVETTLKPSEVYIKYKGV